MRAPLLMCIRLYQRALSPLLPPACRYQPTCSRYAYEAIDRHGSRRGSWLAMKRLARCHPGRVGGYDPVPEPASVPATSADDPSTSAAAHPASKLEAS